MPAVKSYSEFRQDVLASYYRAIPPDTRNADSLIEWLLNTHCELLERYALYQEFHKSQLDALLVQSDQ